MNRQTVAKSLDTSSIKYFFHDAKSIIILERGEFYQPNYFIPFIHCSTAILYQYSKSYESELQQEIEVLLKSMHPKDLITIPLYYDIEVKQKDYCI